MYTLGIETSCDETSVAVVENGRRILSCRTASSLRHHKKYGGIVPEIASRVHLETLDSVAELALKDASVKMRRIGAICVTQRPGLIGSLLVGICFAKGLSMSFDIPLLGIDHLHSHLYSVFLDGRKPEFPFIGLIVSGGHTSLFRVDGFDRLNLIGQTVDDACGEAFDKVAKILGLGYPGGPYIENIANKGDPRRIKFSCSNTRGELDFSFSGIKTAVLYRRKACGPGAAKEIPDIASAFQETVIDTLIKKAFLGCHRSRIKRLVLGGGVIANNRLRVRFQEEAERDGLKIYLPRKNLCTDNAAMVAGIGYRLFKMGYRSELNLSAES
ncbi:MAG: tRNA (adenosine(37)-N6)-threonylcarbamoyltransferase complex transferase subunit TsaD [Candidatus Omnitrophica bacterium]|nr:tRNA (adenosine(37)-N6)-threonylcarbamoyltransferase complex transferase subunit TsaD [Candidatus Omnitrophota bacterium]